MFAARKPRNAARQKRGDAELGGAPRERAAQLSLRLVDVPLSRHEEAAQRRRLISSHHKVGRQRAAPGEAASTRERGTRCTAQPACRAPDPRSQLRQLLRLLFGGHWVPGRRPCGRKLRRTPRRARRRSGRGQLLLLPVQMCAQNRQALLALLRGSLSVHQAASTRFRVAPRATRLQPQPPVLMGPRRRR